jgi:hypothetical protein
LEIMTAELHSTHVFCRSAVTTAGAHAVCHPLVNSGFAASAMHTICISHNRAAMQQQLHWGLWMTIQMKICACCALIDTHQHRWLRTFLHTQSRALFLLLLKQPFWPISALTVEQWVFLLALASDCPAFTPCNASCFLKTLLHVYDDWR